MSVVSKVRVARQPVFTCAACGKNVWKDRSGGATTVVTGVRLNDICELCISDLHEHENDYLSRTFAGYSEPDRFSLLCGVEEEPLPIYKSEAKWRMPGWDKKKCPRLVRLAQAKALEKKRSKNEKNSLSSSSSSAKRPRL